MQGRFGVDDIEDILNDGEKVWNISILFFGYLQFNSFNFNFILL